MKSIYRYHLGIKRRILKIIDRVLTSYKFWLNDVRHGSFRTCGTPMIHNEGNLIVGNAFAMNNALSGNVIGYNTPCILYVAKGKSLKIGSNVGVSQVSIIASDNIIIGDDVKIGGGTHIFATDFHSLDANIRKTGQDRQACKHAPILIGNNVFIGAGCLILKGVTIGDNSIIGANSVVTKDIPANQIWAGNPAIFIRNTI